RNPQNAQAFYLKGQIIQEQLGSINDLAEYEAKVGEMTEAYNQASLLDSELGDDIVQKLRIAYYNVFQKGIQAFNRGQNDKAAYNDAAEYFRIATVVGPDSSGAFVNQGYALMNAGRQQEAIEPFEQALAKGDNQTETYVFLS